MFHTKYGPFLLKFLSSQWQLKCVRFKIYRNSYSIEILAYHRYLQHVTYKYVIINYLFRYFAICAQTFPMHRNVVYTCLIFLWQKLTVKNTWHAFHSVFEIPKRLLCYFILNHLLPSSFMYISFMDCQILNILHLWFTVLYQ